MTKQIQYNLKNDVILCFFEKSSKENFFYYWEVTKRLVLTRMCYAKKTTIWNIFAEFGMQNNGKDLELWTCEM